MCGFLYIGVSIATVPQKKPKTIDIEKIFNRDFFIFVFFSNITLWGLAFAGSEMQCVTLSQGERTRAYLFSTLLIASFYSISSVREREMKSVLRDMTAFTEEAIEDPPAPVFLI